MAAKKKGHGDELKEEMAEDVEMEEEGEGEGHHDEETESKPQVYIPGQGNADDGEELECDESAYVMLHRFQTKYPCLSFDPLHDQLGETRTTFPMSCMLVAGTQAEKPRDNSVVVMKLTNLQKIKQKPDKGEDDESSSSEDEDSDDDEASATKPKLFSASIVHHGGINRVRAAKGMSQVCAAWNDQGKVQMWNLTSALNALENLTDKNRSTVINEKPLFTFTGHQGEGFAMDWSKVALGKFASGDVRKNIHVWRMMEGGTWAVDQKPLNAHKSSVEDVQWSPTEDDMLASCSSDKTIRLWDTRCAKTDACVCVLDNAHESDVNVISWNNAEPTLLLSGGDDNSLKVWDLKFVSRGQPVAHFKHHTAPITSVQWFAHDSTVFAAAGEDNQISIWDLAVEPDDEQEMMSGDEKAKVQPQLLFIHQGQEEIKEIQWVSQLPGVMISTALDGFNIFRTISV